MSEPFLAEVRIWGLNFAPRSWAFCDGQLLPISQNTALFSLIGTTYGGDGRTTTALPNMKGRAPMHPGRGVGLTPRPLGQKGGSDTVTLNANQMPAHNHAMGALNTLPATSSRPAGKALAETAPGEEAYVAGTGSLTHTSVQATTVAAGGSISHNNLQPYLTLNFTIALQGTYPSRS